jgi:hypothetical protein
VLVTSELPCHRHHGTQTCQRKGKILVLLGQVGLIADIPDDRDDVEHMLGFISKAKLPKPRSMQSQNESVTRRLP